MSSKAKAIGRCKGCICYNCNMQEECHCPLKGRDTKYLKKKDVVHCNNYKEVE